MKRHIIVLAVVLVLALAACAPVTPSVQHPTRAQLALAEHYAPVIYHGTASDQDYLTRADFDGDWISNNNWENQPTGDLSAYVYYSVVETETHWFIFYSLFHPRDYEKHPCKEGGCHENDLESVQLAVLKDGTEFGRLQAMETLAHNSIYLYPVDDEVQGGYLKPDGRVRWEDGHPVIYVEPYGHGIRGKRINLGGHHLVYRVGEEAQRPQGLDGEVTYRLISIYDTLWQRRDSIGDGKTFDRKFFYGRNILPAAFDGDTWGFDKANTPWGYSQARGRKLHRGDWFLDPAKAMAFHATFPEPFSHRYVANPYLADLKLLSATGENMRGKQK